MRKVEVNHKALVTVNRPQEADGVLKLLLHGFLPSRVTRVIPRTVSTLEHCSTKTTIDSIKQWERHLYKVGELHLKKE